LSRSFLTGSVICIFISIRTLMRHPI